RPEDGPIRVVVERGEIISPDEDDLRLRDEERRHCAAKTLRPRRGLPERRPRPIERAHPARHLGITRKDVEELALLGARLRHRPPRCGQAIVYDLCHTRPAWKRFFGGSRTPGDASRGTAVA